MTTVVTDEKQWYIELWGSVRGQLKKATIYTNLSSLHGKHNYNSESIVFYPYKRQFKKWPTKLIIQPFKCPCLQFDRKRSIKIVFIMKTSFYLLLHVRILGSFVWLSLSDVCGQHGNWSKKEEVRIPKAAGQLSIQLPTPTIFWLCHSVFPHPGLCCCHDGSYQLWTS